jgi:hypothetical protein
MGAQRLVEYFTTEYSLQSGSTGFMLVRQLTTRRRHRVRRPIARSEARQAPALNVIHFIVVTDAMSWICILMHDGARSDA